MFCLIEMSLRLQRGSADTLRLRIVSRDRSDIYATAARLGAPQAIQITDKWHLLKNLGEALQSAGGSFADVVKLNYFCVDRVDRSQLAVVRSTRDRYVNTQAPR